MWSCNKCKRSFPKRNSLIIHNAFNNCDVPIPNENSVDCEDDVNEYEEDDDDDSIVDPDWHPEPSPRKRFKFIEEKITHGQNEFKDTDVDHSDTVNISEEFPPCPTTSVIYDSENSPIGKTTEKGIRKQEEEKKENGQTFINNIDTAEDSLEIVNDVEEPATFPRTSVTCNTENSPIRKKRQKGIRKRDEETKKKEQGLPFINRKGMLMPGKSFKPVDKCCRMKCFDKCKPKDQRKIFDDFRKKPNEVKDNILISRMNVSEKKSERKGRGKGTGNNFDRAISVSYFIVVDIDKIKVRKTIFMQVHGIKKGKIAYLLHKLRSSTTGTVCADQRGRHTPSNKLKYDERKEIEAFINKYPRHESHYSRRDSSGEKYLPSHLNIKKIHEEYKEMRKKRKEISCAGYDVFRDVFHSTGYKFKQPYVDTCKKCDEFKVLKRHSASKEERDVISTLHDSHVLEAQKRYESKRVNKFKAKENIDKRVLVFDLQQVLPTPYLSTNIAYYKRLLSTYNLTIRDCSIDESTDCYMWDETTGGRGSDQIASCVFKKIMDLPNNVKHVTTYSDTCGGQNRNINIAVMFSLAVFKKQTLEVIDQKFLLPGHTRLECDSDHSRIEKAKKRNQDISIMIPRDWYQFVRMIRGKTKFKVTEMEQTDFFAFSKLLNDTLVKRIVDENGQKVEWLKIRWLRCTEPFGTIYFKYSLDNEDPFRTLNLRRKRIGRPMEAGNVTVPLSYSKPIGINPLKKADFLSMLNLLDRYCHNFYRDLSENGRSKEYDELEDAPEDDTE